MAPQLVLRVNQADYAGWKTAQITQDMEAIAGSFEIDYFDRWQGTAWSHPIFKEAGCQLLFGDEPLISGFIDTMEGDLSASDHSLKVSGRDAAGALVDCAPNLPIWEFANASLETVARAMAEPFGINVSIADNVGELPPVRKMVINPGDTAFHVLEQACRMAGVLKFSDGRGGIVIARGPTGRANCHLVEGENVLKASASVDMKERFRIYRVMGQRPGTPFDTGARTAGYSDAGASKPVPDKGRWSDVGTAWKKKKADKPNAVAGWAEDLQVQRTNRMKVILAEGGLSGAMAQRRAEWERDVRAARSEELTVTVQGWTQAPGRYGPTERLWKVNELVGVSIPVLGIENRELLVSKVVLQLSPSAGTTATLTLKQPAAFAPEPIASKDAGLWTELADGAQVKPKAGTADTFRALR